VGIKKLINNGDGTFSVPLSRGMFAIIDKIDVNIVGLYNWHVACGKGLCYAQRNIPKEKRKPGGPKVIKMHRFIMGLNGPMVDHKDGDGLNNRRNNIRHATSNQNGVNRKKSRRNQSGYKGVTRTKEGYWRGVIAYQGKQWSLSHTRTPEESARIYDLYAIVYHGEFARTNFPRSDYPEEISESDLPKCRKNMQGENNPGAKLTCDQVRKIRERLSQRQRGEMKFIAEEFGISYSLAWQIATGKKWASC
jgi:hypothetical protein